MLAMCTHILSSFIQAQVGLWNITRPFPSLCSGMGLACETNLLAYVTCICYTPILSGFVEISFFPSIIVITL